MLLHQTEIQKFWLPDDSCATKHAPSCNYTGLQQADKAGKLQIKPGIYLSLIFSTCPLDRAKVLMLK